MVIVELEEPKCLGGLYLDFSEHKTHRNLMVHHHVSYLLIFYLFVSGVYIIFQTRPSVGVDMFCFNTHTHTVDDLKGSDAEEDRTAKWKWCLVSGDMQVIVLIIK
jgi:hypothetical protein